VNRQKLLITFAIISCLILTGCQNIQKDTEPFSKYYMTSLKVSTSSDALAILQPDNANLLSQSESVIVSWKHEKDSRKIWFTAVAFNEEELTAVRKYGFFSHEKAKGFFVAPTLKLRLDAEIIITDEQAFEPYANENVKRIALLKNAARSFETDLSDAAEQGQPLDSAKMMAAETLNDIIYQLERSPAMASKLSQPDGFTFDHLNLGKGKIRMIIRENTVKIKIKIGSSTNSFKDHQDVKTM
jgi:hypothetical protein